MAENVQDEMRRFTISSLDSLSAFAETMSRELRDGEPIVLEDVEILKYASERARHMMTSYIARFEEEDYGKGAV
jgi:outer membrane lipopolysaccharide assembly protein LptE/RlpB